MEKRLLSQLITILQGYGEVIAVAINGSVVRDSADEWSDLDVIVVVTDMKPFFPSLTWLHPIGKIFTYDQSANARRCISRIVFDDLRHVDLSFYTLEAVLKLTSEDSVSFWQGAEVVVSRSESVSEKLSATYTPPISTFSREDFETMANDFWFKCVLAVTKVARNDRLIAAHLVLDCWRDVMVLAMVERDLATGTTVHKTGGMGNDFVEQMPSIPDYRASTLLSQLEEAATHFEALARRLYPDYVSVGQKLTTLIHRAS